MKKGLIVTDYGEKTGVGNYAISIYDSFKDNLNIDFLNLYSSKTFKNFPKEGKTLNIGNFYFGFFSGSSGRKLKKYLRENHYDYIILSHQGMGYLIPYITEIDIQIITVLHDLMSYTVYKNNLLHKIFRFISTRNIIKSQKIVLTSKMTERDFLNMGWIYSGKTKIIHEYIDKTKYYKMNENEENSLKYLKDSYKVILTSVTNGQSHKNDITFFKLAKEFPEYFFVKVGYISNECRQYIEGYYLKNVKILDKISLDMLRELYNITDIYVHTSIKEGFGYPPHEALFCGSKLLTTQSIDMQTGEGIYVVDDFYDIEAYKKGLIILLNQILNFSNEEEYSSSKFSNEFIRFIDA